MGSGHAMIPSLSPCSTKFFCSLEVMGKGRKELWATGGQFGHGIKIINQATYSEVNW